MSDCEEIENSHLVKEVRTPRKSARKSTRPVQEIHQVITKMSLRSTTKESIAEGEETIRWTPAKVGRTSEKRKSRKRRNTVNRKLKMSELGNSTDIDIEKEEGDQAQSSSNSEEKEERILVKDKENNSHELELLKNLTCQDDVQENLNTSQEGNQLDLERIVESCSIMVENEKMNEIDVDISRKIQISETIEEQRELNDSKETDVEKTVLSVDNYNQVCVESLAVSEVEKNQSLDDTIAIEIIDDSIDLGKDEDNVEKSLNRTFDKIDEDDTEELLPEKNSKIKSPNDSVIIIETPPKSMLPTSKINSNLSSAKKRSTKGYRSGTPYKANVKNSKLPITPSAKGRTPLKMFVSKLKPKENFAFCKLGDDEKDIIKRNREVKFHSPSNQTLVIEEFDKLIKETVKKSKTDKEKNITKRHKRSRSVDDISMKTSEIDKDQNMVKSFEAEETFSKSSAKRTRLPNFSAIHKKNFDKMENIVDHVTRKAERAKLLGSSSTKIPIGSGKKLETLKYPNARELKENKPKAAKQINLSQSISKLENTVVEKHDRELSIKRPGCIPINLAPGVLKLKGSPKKTKNVAKPKVNLKIPASKPAFNLSTALPKPLIPSSLDCSKITIKKTSPTFAEKAAKTHEHINRFKGSRKEMQKESKAKNKALIQGVRSNRRFELQMKHRFQMDEKENN